MSLTNYHKKRQFTKTPEPKGKKLKSADGPLTFVVQKHEASRLHYDFRLELDGTLKSWAVPKGPSLNPEDKHLAVMVEDHPLEYAGFEGIIPKGNYGAGNVMVWDKGVYTPLDTVERKKAEKILKDQLKKGHLTFVLLGEKLKGEFALIKTHGEDEDTWLLIKKGDEYASKKDILKQDKSVLTNRSMPQIQKQAIAKNEVWISNKKTSQKLKDPVVEINLNDAPEENLPHKIKPMLAQTIDEPFNKKGWIFEVKWDGYRTIAEIKGGNVELYSRNHLSFNEKFAPIKNALGNFSGDAILDGEVVAVDSSGKPVFQLLQDYPESNQGEIIYYVFDILHYQGHNLRGLPLIERKEILNQLLPNQPNIRFSDHIEEKGQDFFKETSKMGLEGIVAKNSSSNYALNQRSDSWLKIKTGLSEEAIIAGFTKGKGGRKYFGALVLGIYRKGKLVYIGHTGGGFDEKMLESVFSKLKPLEQKACPFETVPETNTPATWVKPILVCEVKFKQWTTDGRMRHPVFVGLREDKDAPEIIQDVPDKTKPESPDEEVLIGKRKLKLVNLSKVFWPKEGYTKGDLISYYREIAPIILPHLIGRPESLLRYPNGIEGQNFFQKDVSNLKLDWMMRARIAHHHAKVEYMLVQDEAALIYLINLGCIDLNPWSSRIGKLDYPDYLVIDLDPLDVSFEKVIEVAQTCRQVLEDLNIESFPKTSGATGIHIYIPMGAKYTYDQVKNFAHLLCIQINSHIPDLTSLERLPKNRPKKVYLDFLQNNRGQTLASVYSVRPGPEAPVSTPLTWNEVTKSLTPTQFTIKNIPARLQKKGDLFKKILEKRVDIKKVLTILEKL